MSYDDLDINAKINLKGLVAAWQRIAVDRFQEELTEKLYGRKRSRKKRNGPASRLRQTRQLLGNWHTSMTGSGDDVKGSQISFLLYGRFVDMGVGNGTDYALSRYQSVRKNGEKRTRVPVRWYSKRKGYETHRLRELLAQHHIDVPLETLENALTTRVEFSL